MTDSGCDQRSDKASDESAPRFLPDQAIPVQPVSGNIGRNRRRKERAQVRRCNGGEMGGVWLAVER